MRRFLAVLRALTEGTLMAGGQEVDIERIRPYVLAMGQRLTRMGDVEPVETTKLCNQIIYRLMVVMAETARLAVDAGIDAARLPKRWLEDSPVNSLAAGLPVWPRA